jgi:hypothetical protein
MKDSFNLSVLEDAKLKWITKVTMLMLICVGMVGTLERFYRQHFQALQKAEVSRQTLIKQEIQTVEKQKTAAIHYQKLLSGVELKPLPEMSMQPTQFLEELYQWIQQTTNKLNQVGIKDESDACYGFATCLKESQVPNIQSLAMDIENKAFLDFLMMTLIEAQPQSIRNVTCSSDHYGFIFSGSLPTFDAWITIVAESPIPLILDAFALDTTTHPATIAVSLKKQAVLPKLQTHYNRYTACINSSLQLNSKIAEPNIEVTEKEQPIFTYRIQFKGYYNLGKAEADNQLLLYDQETHQWIKGKTGQYYPDLGIRIVSIQTAPSLEGMYTNRNFILTLWDDRLQRNLDIYL